MYGGFWGRTNLALVLGVGLFAATPASSADLGGDCCADLEERVAELEATTARKGNRKVSLTVSGWVNESVVWWDDGVEQNVYVGTNFVEQSRFKSRARPRSTRNGQPATSLSSAFRPVHRTSGTN
jgi:CubicO group peptidase (beta-lactamase class C family)